LGWKGNVIRDYFLNEEDYRENGFALPSGGLSLELLPCDSGNWTITFAETGEYANIGQRLKAVGFTVQRLKGQKKVLGSRFNG
jgi:glucose-1-phosphate cytidylyltransferase